MFLVAIIKYKLNNGYLFNIIEIMEIYLIQLKYNGKIIEKMEVYWKYNENNRNVKKI